MPRLTATDLLFTCKIDKYSEAEIVTLVKDINYAIDNMVMSIMAISQTADPMPVPRTPLAPAHLMGYLDEHWYSRGNVAEFAAEFILVMPDASHLTNTPASWIGCHAGPLTSAGFRKSFPLNNVAVLHNVPCS